MPSQTPTTFASAAASNGTGDGTSARSNIGSGDWSRPRMNGSQTFRRPTQLNTSVSGHTRDASVTVQTPSSGVYVPPHMNSAFGRNASAAESSRYSKSDVLDIYKTQSDSQSKDLSSVLTESWAPGQAATGGSSWGRRDERDPNPGPEICWDGDGATKPLGLTPLTDDEKELFTTSVNSLVKPPQPVVKEGVQTPGLNGRKSSISQGTGSLSSRPGVRRRDTTESFGGNPLASPTFQRGGRDENPLASPPPSLMRRRTDLKDAFGSSDIGRIDTNVETKSPFGSLRRTTTNPLSAGLTGPSSPWAAEPQSAGGFGRMGSFGILDQPGTPSDKKSGLGSLGAGTGSRFMRDLRKDPNEETSKTRSSLGLLDKLAEESNPPSQRQSRLGHRSDEVEGHAGSAALGGEDSSPQEQSQLKGSDNLSFREHIHEQNNPLRDVESSQQHHLTGSFEPMSPTDTNPYHSPEHERSNTDRSHIEDQESQDNMSQGVGHGQQRRPHLEQSEHGSRPGSTAPPNRGMAPLGNFGQFNSLGGWPGQSPMNPSAPGRSPFAAEPISFGSLGDLGTPGAGGVFSPPGTTGQGAFGGPRQSKLGSLFPTQMQDQMRAQETRPDFFSGLGQSNIPPRDTDSPAGRSRNPVDDLFSGQPGNRGPGTISSPFGGFDTQFGQPSAQLQNAPGFSAAIGTPGISAHSQHWPSAVRRSPDNDSNSMPATQQRTMVMPDRMRWVYQDPSGNVQGPFSGLEMHDWYKAGFFSPELLVKKVEDTEHEPLAQLIRRIGNSREPFLVPQIGIAHGSTLGGQGAGVSGVSGAPAAGNIQPPFASSFPSFGTTLTAEQQNALERRKQEEQYLMAQQKEFLQAKQQMMRNAPFPSGPSSIHPGQLQHHSSAHSLQSQPSFGSMGGGPFQSGQGNAAPLAGHDPFGLQRPHAGGFGPVGPLQSGPQHREDDLSSSFERSVNLARASQSPFAGGIGGLMTQPGAGHKESGPVSQMLHDRGRLQQQQLEAMQMSERQPQDPNEGLDRYEEFQRLRQGEAQVGVIGKPQLQTQPQSQQVAEEFVQSIEPDDEEYEEEPQFEEEELEPPTRPDIVSMPSKDVTDVRTTAPEDVPAAQSAWAPIEKPVAQPIDAPAPSISPLPAPAAQRANQRVVEALAAENRSRSQTPSVETPSSSLAPWAKEAPEVASRGPSLKEIQDAEARQAAQREAEAAARRREALEQERRAREAMPEPIPGLPSSASWATSGTPASPGASAWTKPAVGAKAAVGAAKKTLAQIQKEEEARKSKQLAAAASISIAAVTSSTAVGGKRYAELAGRTTQASPSPNVSSGTGAWSTVGPSGKTKGTVPVGPGRTASGPIPTASPITVKKPAPPVRTNTMQTASANANEQVAKWARATMGRGLNAGINGDEFVKTLMAFPLEVDIIADCIYSSSNSLEGRRLAEEFIRHRKLADKGIAPENVASASSGVGSSTGSTNNGGWNEVAKSKPAPKEESNSPFKVVQKKKQTKR